MDRMKIIKKRLSMSLHSVRRLDESLSELPEHTGLDEAPLSRGSGENKLSQKLYVQTHSFKESICTLMIVHDTKFVEFLNTVVIWAHSLC